MIDVETVQQTNCFRYITCLVTEDGYCATDIHSRMKMANRIFQDKRNYT